MISLLEMEHMILILALLVCTVMDIRKKMIYLPFVLGCSLLIVILRILAGELSLASVVTAALVLFIFCGISILSSGQLGMGDGILFGMTGLALSTMEQLCMLFYCFLTVFFAAMLLVLVFHGKKESRIPLAPFILVSSLFVIL